jgi:hypothetical protein
MARIAELEGAPAKKALLSYLAYLLGASENKDFKLNKEDLEQPQGLRTKTIEHSFDHYA